MWPRIPVLVAAGALGLVSCGIEGVSVSGPETTVGFVTGASSHGEDDGSIFIAVELTTEHNELPQPVSVTVSDGLSGSATSGADYQPFTATEVVVPPGTTSGATALVRVTALGDSLAEGATETVRLVLSDASGAFLGTLSETVLGLADAETADVRFLQTASSTPDESTASYDMDLELVLSAGATLAFDIDLVVADSGAGTATSAADYAAFAAAAIQFSAGTASGTTRTVTVDVLDDAESEGPETVQLSLSGSDLSRLALAGPTGHTLTIVDDESTPTPLFSASHGPSTGLETTLSPGGTIDLGATTNGGAATTGTLLVLANQGGADMLLGQPTFEDEADAAAAVSAALAVHKPR
ncbi:MAG: Calx-beta domain-containing protein, partial [Planctomycetota bacterium]